MEPSVSPKRHEIIQVIPEGSKIFEDNFIRKLPQEIFVTIFSFLPVGSLFQVKKVCRDWNYLVQRFRTQLFDYRFFNINVPDGPGARLCHTSVIHKNTLYIIGGDDGEDAIGNIKKDIWTLNLEDKKWKLLPYTLPKTLTEACSVAYNNSIYVFGGITQSTTRSNDVYEINLQTKQSHRVITQGPSPDPGSCHAHALYKNELVVFGGWNPSLAVANNNEFHALNLDTLTWRVIPQGGDVPPKRRALKAFVHNDEFYVFGGFTDKATNDFFKYNFASGKWQKLEPQGTFPSARSRYAWVKNGNSVYMLGGYNGIRFLNEFYQLKLDSMTWHQISTNFPFTGFEAIGQHAMQVYEDQLLIFGGNDGNSARKDLFSCFV